MSVLSAVKDYIATCPYLTEYAKVNVDFLPDNPDTYSIEPAPTAPVVRKYLDGSREEQLVFVFASRLYYSEETQNNINNSGFFESFREWLRNNTENGILPTLPEGYTATSIEAITAGYLFDVSGDLSNARYQIQCRLIYDAE